jgi:hypothetical protein
MFPPGALAGLLDVEDDGEFIRAAEAAITQ